MFRTFLVAASLSACTTSGTAIAQASSCNAPDGWETIADRAEGQFLIFGEMHGTNEIPTVVGNYVCEVSNRDGRTLVGLEISSSYQDTIDAAKQSTNPRDVLLDGMGDHWSVGDGRGSTAMLDLIIRLLRLDNVYVHAFAAPLKDPESSPDQRGMAKPPIGERHQLRSEGMRSNITNAFEGYNRAIVLTGNIHAAEAAFDYLDGADNLAMLLPGDPITLDSRYDEGTIWKWGHHHKGGVTPIKANLSNLPTSVTASTMGISDTMSARYDGYLYVGPVTASPPAIP